MCHYDHQHDPCLVCYRASKGKLLLFSCVTMGFTCANETLLLVWIHTLKWHQYGGTLFVSLLVLFPMFQLIRFYKGDIAFNHNYIKILESDWSSAGLISAVIVQLHTSCACNWTVVRVMPE